MMKYKLIMTLISILLLGCKVKNIEYEFIFNNKSKTNTIIVFGCNEGHSLDYEKGRCVIAIPDNGVLLLSESFDKNIGNASFYMNKKINGVSKNIKFNVNSYIQVTGELCDKKEYKMIYLNIDEDKLITDIDIDIAIGVVNENFCLPPLSLSFEK